jgi:small subunit ribosomal protein S18
MKINRPRKPVRKTNRKSNIFMPFKKRFCRFCTDKIKSINYKDLKILESFIKERGRIVSARSSGNCARHQRQLTRAIKKARFMALIPYVRI